MRVVSPKTLLIDTKSVLTKACHSTHGKNLPPSKACDMYLHAMLAAIHFQNPTHIYAAWSSPTETLIRRQFYPTYKNNNINTPGFQEFRDQAFQIATGFFFFFYFFQF